MEKLKVYKNMYELRIYYLMYHMYGKSSIRSRPCIILDTKFHRLVLEVLKRLQFLEQKDFSWATKGPLETPKISKKYYFYVF